MDKIDMENAKMIATFMEFIVVDKRYRKDQIYYTDAPFLGEPKVVYDHSPYPEIELKYIFACSEMLFKESWDWLMAVVDKIENTKTRRFMGFWYGNSNRGAGFVGVINTDIDVDSTCRIEEIVGHIDGNRKDATYKAVVEFIKWYNDNKD